MKKRLLTKILALMLCVMIFVSAVGCSRATSGAGIKQPTIEQAEDDSESSEGETSPDEQPTETNGNEDESTEGNSDVTLPDETNQPTESVVETPNETTADESTQESTAKPTEAPTTKPTEAPTTKPTEAPTSKPTEAPTTKPIETPTTSEELVFANHSYDNIREYAPNGVSAAEITGVHNVLKSIINTKMTDVQKIKAVHDWMVKNTTYDSNYYNRSDAYNFVYNLVNNKVAVCQGYAVTFYVMMTELEIPCTIVSGYAGEEHAWNAVKLDGYWYYVDVTWDDPIMTDTGHNIYADGSNISYEYLLCTYTSISKNHTTTEYHPTNPTPNGTSNAYNEQMYMLSGISGIFRVNSMADIDTVATQIKAIGKYVVFIENDSLNVEEVIGTLFSKFSVPGAKQYGVTYSGSCLTFTIS